MTTFLKSLMLAVLLSGSSAVFAQTFTDKSSIKVANLRTGCVDLTIPYVEADILINDEDRGLPGVLYVGTTNQQHSEAYFATSGGWQGFSSGLIPPYQILSSGLSNTTVRLYVLTMPPLMYGSESSAHNVYFGYGALTVANERLVQSSIAAVQRVKQQFPDKKISSIEPDHMRLTLVQDNMTKNAKYQFVINGYDFPRCEPTSIQ